MYFPHRQHLAECNLKSNTKLSSTTTVSSRALPTTAKNKWPLNICVRCTEYQNRIQTFNETCDENEKVENTRNTKYIVPCHNLNFGSRAFPVSVPKICNTLPPSVIVTASHSLLLDVTSRLTAFSLPLPPLPTCHKCAPILTRSCLYIP